ncbi:transcription antitermination factor NusB [Candidatus Hydrogenedentota bacterium]
MSKTGIRRQGRERAMQILYQLEFGDRDVNDVLSLYWENHGTRQDVKKFAEELVRGVLRDCEEIDREISEAAKGWSLDRMGRIELNILRVSVYELDNSMDIPVNVAIDEAVEIARRFSGEEAVPFINGILDTIAKKIQELS